MLLKNRKKKKYRQIRKYPVANCSWKAVVNVNFHDSSTQSVSSKVVDIKPDCILDECFFLPFSHKNCGFSGLRAEQ